ncbi:altered inheritance of mitochondria protein 31, mitochondrial [Polyplosphaeria fusca]|uniref:Altered inheritance of mitochondria protein 31, mitochondrial n=1 Tax=Polyplosphaeria fusca TaxID=682080 RepID=A0A9P4QMC6_9PLEO|nr:altered inheritance of mitochondria protein 31, mitochondrial [Polyplosphaeria fusca]
MSDPNGAPFPSSFDGNEDFYNESIPGKLWRRFREEPLIPLGCGLTVWAIVGASRSMRRGDSKMTNLYFRRRLYAQAFTIAVLCAGNIYWQKDRVRRRDWNKMVKEKEAQDRRERWLKELEVRDEDEKAFQESLAKKAKAKGEQQAAGVAELKEKTKDLNNLSFGSK